MGMHADCGHMIMPTSMAVLNMQVMTIDAVCRSFGLIVGVSCLWCASVVPGVWVFLRVTHASHDN